MADPKHWDTVAARLAVLPRADVIRFIGRDAIASVEIPACDDVCIRLDYGWDGIKADLYSGLRGDPAELTPDELRTAARAMLAVADAMDPPPITAASTPPAPPDGPTRT